MTHILIPIKDIEDRINHLKKLALIEQKAEDFKSEEKILIEIAIINETINRGKQISFSEERILCSAIWYKELDKMSEKWVHEIESFIRPKNIDQGIVICGYRHPSCMYTMVAITGKRSVEPECGKYIQGFLTSENRFVDREEGALIHLKNGNELNYSSKDLYSEDLY